MNALPYAITAILLTAQLRHAAPPADLMPPAPLSTLQDFAAFEDSAPEQNLVVSPETAACLATMLSQLSALLENQPDTSPILNDQTVSLMSDIIITIIAAHTTNLDTKQTPNQQPTAQTAQQDVTGHLVATTFCSIASSFAAIVAQPHNKQVVAHSIAQMFAALITIIRDVTTSKKSIACSVQDVVEYLATHNKVKQAIDRKIAATLHK